MSALRNAAIAGVTLLVLAWVLVRPDQLYVERIEFSGTEQSTPAQLRHLADIHNGTLIWSVNLAEVSERVQRHPWVEAVTVERRLPGTIRVEVVEREPVALLAWEGRLLYVDRRGRPFLDAHTDDLDHPVITGLSPEDESRNDKLPRLVIHDALWLLDQLDTRQLVPRDQVSEVAFHPARGFEIQTTGAQPGRPTARILVGLGSYERQLDHLAALLDKGVDLTEPLHVDVAPRKVAIVRPRDPLGVPAQP